MTRWWAAAASGYCLTVGLSFVGADPGERDSGWVLCGTALALTLLPQLFRRRAAFLVACWMSVLLISAAAFLLILAGGCVLLPAAGLLFFAAILPPGVWRRPKDLSSGASS